MGLLTLKINKFSAYKTFYFLLIVVSIFRERIAMPIWPYYIKPLETYIGISIPFIMIIFMKRSRFLFTKSAILLCIVFITFFTMNYISIYYGKRYSLIGEYVSCLGVGTRFSGPPVAHEDIIYCFRLGLLFLIALCIMVGLTLNYNLLISSIYKAFIISGLIVIVWIIMFPSYTKTNLARFTGPIGDPNYAAGLLIISINISTYFMLVSKKKVKRIGNLLLSGVFLITIVASLSRGALLGAMFSLVMLFSAVMVSKRNCFINGILMIKKTYFNRILTAFLLGIISVMVLFFMRPALFNTFWERSSIDNITSEKDQHRQTLWRFGLSSIAENPVGYGMGQMEKKHAFLDPSHTKFGHSTAVHNIVLQIGGAFGWLGMLVFILLLLFVSLISINLLRKERYSDNSCRTSPVPIATSFLGLSVQAMLFNFLFLKYYWMIIALVLAYYEYEKRKIQLGLKTTV